MALCSTSIFLVSWRVSFIYFHCMHVSVKISVLEKKKEKGKEKENATETSLGSAAG